MTDIASSMKLNHLSFPSNDVAASARFFERQLGCSVAMQDGYAIVKRPGFDIVVERADGFDVAWPRNFHVGFELPRADDVRALHDRFVADGIEISAALHRSPRGSRFFCAAPGGLLFEINTLADADAAYRGTFS